MKTLLLITSAFLIAGCATQSTPNPIPLPLITTLTSNGFTHLSHISHWTSSPTHLYTFVPNPTILSHISLTQWPCILQWI